jgi:hypothetical protein
MLARHYNQANLMVLRSIQPAPVPHTVKKVSDFSLPLQECHLSNSPRPGIIKLFPARESLVRVTSRLGTGKSLTFFTVHLLFKLLGHEMNIVFNGIKLMSNLIP